MDTRQRFYLEAMGIQVWEQRQPANIGKSSIIEIPEEVLCQVDSFLPPSERVPGWEELAARVANCTACPLHKNRTQTVFGAGSREAKWLIVGEAPGADEDRQGEPFVGRAGRLLNAMLQAVGLQRSQVYIANILKCRPPNNRDPLPEEVTSCESHLQHQVALLQPRVILALGRVAAQNLLKTSTPLGRLRGVIHQYPDTTIPLIVTYHPAYLLRSPREKRRAWQDLQLTLKVYRGL